MTPDQLRQAREALGLSQQGLADELRMGEQGHRRIREMEQGQREITGPVSVAVELMVERVGMEFLLAEAYSDEGEA